MVLYNATLEHRGQSVTLVYVDGTRGWKHIQDSTSEVTGAPFYCSYRWNNTNLWRF